MKVQEAFKDLGTVTLDKLDAYIAACSAVVHLVGEMTGAAAKAQSTKTMLARYSDLADKLPPLREPIENAAVSRTSPHQTALVWDIPQS